MAPARVASAPIIALRIMKVYTCGRFSRAKRCGE